MTTGVGDLVKNSLGQWWWRDKASLEWIKREVRKQRLWVFGFLQKSFKRFCYKGKRRNGVIAGGGIGLRGQQKLQDGRQAHGTDPFKRHIEEAGEEGPHCWNSLWGVRREWNPVSQQRWASYQSRDSFSIQTGREAKCMGTDAGRMVDLIVKR